jgi:prepilin-type N-terminal cleavage/methylation domain-containing protein
MRHRPGVTLVEVLVAIFIMAIGMLALLALFPLGAISMAQALKDDRCAQSAVNAEAFAVAQDMRHDVMVEGGPAPVGAYNNAFAIPFGTVGPLTSDLSLVPGYTGPSYGVIVDPFTYPLDASGLNQQNVGRVAGASLGLPRRSIAFSVNTGRNVPMTSPEAARWCSMLDGITFIRGDNVGPNAVPDLSSGPVIRDNRYTWAWLLRRPRWSDDSVIDMSVIVYSGRPTVTLTGEPTFAVVGGPVPAGSNSITINYGAGPKPSLRSGGWILDVTPTTLVAGPPAVQVVYGYPYRVVNVSDTGANQLTLELQTPIRTGTSVSLVTVLEYAVEIFDRGSFVQP